MVRWLLGALEKTRARAHRKVAGRSQGSALPAMYTYSLGPPATSSLLFSTAAISVVYYEQTKRT
jgi:hypothetical protein